MDSHETKMEWPDFYELLHIAPTANDDVIGRIIIALDAQARVNWEHPDKERRRDFRHMAEVTLPQCRRVLLDRRSRTLYDRALLAHKSGEPQNFSVFLTTLPEPQKAARPGASLVMHSMPAGMASAIENTPVLLPPRAQRSQALSPTSIYLMTAIVAFNLMNTILPFAGMTA
jgi:hypothetical protein